MYDIITWCQIPCGQALYVNISLLLLQCTQYIRFYAEIGVIFSMCCHLTIITIKLNKKCRGWITSDSIFCGVEEASTPYPLLLMSRGLPQYLNPAIPLPIHTGIKTEEWPYLIRPEIILQCKTSMKINLLTQRANRNPPAHTKSQHGQVQISHHQLLWSQWCQPEELCK